jgi:hypothetical protein
MALKNSREKFEFKMTVILWNPLKELKNTLEKKKKTLQPKIKKQDIFIALHTIKAKRANQGKTRNVC